MNIESKTIIGEPGDIPDDVADVCVHLKRLPDGNESADVRVNVAAFPTHEAGATLHHIAFQMRNPQLNGVEYRVVHVSVAKLAERFALDLVGDKFEPDELATMLEAAAQAIRARAGIPVPADFAESVHNAAEKMRKEHPGTPDEETWLASMEAAVDAVRERHPDAPTPHEIAYASMVAEVTDDAAEERGVWCRLYAQELAGGLDVTADQLKAAEDAWHAAHTAAVEARQRGEDGCMAALEAMRKARQ